MDQVNKVSGERYFLLSFSALHKPPNKMTSGENGDEMDDGFVFMDQVWKEKREEGFEPKAITCRAKKVTGKEREREC